MKRTSKINRISVVKSSKSSDVSKLKGQDGPKSSGGEEQEGQGGGGSSLSPEDMGVGGDEKEKEEKKERKGPGTTTLSDDEKIDDDFMDTIENGLENPEEWNKCDSGTGEGGEPGESMPGGDPSDIDIDGPGGPGRDDGYEGRIFKSPEETASDIDEAIREVLRTKSRHKEGKTDKEKTQGGSGSGGFRDRLEMESISGINWAQIFKTRLTAYSREKATRLPYHRKFVGNPMLRNRITSKTKSKDTLPETNIIIDTSSSLSYIELEVILAEIKGAIIEAKIKKVNLILWTTTAYYHNTYTNVKADSFNQIIQDVQDNWEGGGNNVDTVYNLMAEKGWKNKFTLHFTDGHIKNHNDGKTRDLALSVLNPSHTIFAIIMPSRSVSSNYWQDMKDRFFGEVTPIFLDMDKFHQR
jgi:hypothetical protein